MSARDDFPRGMAQPAAQPGDEAGYRFSVDALLLAAFAPPAHTVADLGCGCGVVGLAMLLTDRAQAIHGYERDLDLADCAEENARRLEVADAFTVQRADLALEAAIPPESVDGVVANPPYYDHTAGRVAPGARGEARSGREGEDPLFTFVQAAARVVKNRSRVSFIYPATRLESLLSALSSARLAPAVLLPVHSRADEDARLVLVSARKNGGENLALRPPLVLYDGDTPSAQARAFCPMAFASSAS